jgi:hypothetical protein
MAGRRRSPCGALLLVALLAAPSGFAVSAAGAVPALGLRPLASVAAPAGGRAGFAFVANFEDLRSDGFHALAGSAHVATSPSYGGEPVLRGSGNRSAPQIEVARTGLHLGEHLVSFQAAVDVGHGTGFVGLWNATGPVAVVGLRGAEVLAGSSPTTARRVGTVPTDKVQPSGWVMLWGEVERNGTGASAPWLLSVYADQTSAPLATNLSVPSAGTYHQALLETTGGTVAYSDVVFESQPIAITIPGYNPMDGYGQGSGSVVESLPSYTQLNATETLRNWSSPERGILSFQVNAMNSTGTRRSTCGGFFQLGVDLEPAGRIAPWYVPGKGCHPNYFGHAAGWAGFASPNGTVLQLSILDEPASAAIVFRIIDLSVTGASRTWTATVHYAGGPFLSTYTQIEWQPVSRFSIHDYPLNATFSNLTISGGNLTSPMPLPASYMVPFALDVPTAWEMGFYRDATSGYDQVA